MLESVSKFSFKQLWESTLASFKNFPNNLTTEKVMLFAGVYFFIALVILTTVAFIIAHPVLSGQLFFSLFGLTGIAALIIFILAVVHRNNPNALPFLQKNIPPTALDATQAKAHEMVDKVAELAKQGSEVLST